VVFGLITGSELISLWATRRETARKLREGSSVEG